MRMSENVCDSVIMSENVWKCIIIYENVIMYEKHENVSEGAITYVKIWQGWLSMICGDPFSEVK
jgi:hypothetical protein